MADGRFVSYLRVSTARQGRSGLGLEAQRAAVAEFLNGGKWTLVEEFVEVESGAKSDRKALAKALAMCRLRDATLVIAKLDRLSRDAAFLLGMQSAGVRFVAADMPEANELTVGIMAVVAQAERKMISSRTKAALAAAKARGVKLGGNRGHLHEVGEKAREAARVAKARRADTRAADLAPVIEDIRQSAGGTASLQAIAAGLDARHIPAPRGGTWSATQVHRVLSRVA